jgi:protein-L-isoaspartate O-methyltransferase
MKAGRRRWIRLVLAVAGGLLLLGLFLPFLELFIRRPRGAFGGQSAGDQLNQERRKLMPPEPILQALNLEAGNTVLDLGAGWGFFTFGLAQAVGEKGKVFATDVDPVAVRFLAAEASRRSASNIFPKLVRARGLDPIYLEHRYDVIFVSDVFPMIEAPEAFFDKLRPSLKQEGKLWVIVSRLDSAFAEVEFGDFMIVTSMIRSGSLPAPIMKRLSPKTREVFANLQEQTLPAGTRRLLVEDLNRMLEDRTLWPEVESLSGTGASLLKAREKPVRDYLAKHLECDGVFATGQGEISDGNRQWLRVLNRLVLQDLLKTEVWERALALDNLPPSEWKTFLTFAWVKSPAERLTDAGYELVRKREDIDYHKVWEFRRAK